MSLARPVIFNFPRMIRSCASTVTWPLWEGGSVLTLRTGSLTASLPTMAIAEPLVASVLGVVVLGETLRPGATGWVLLVAAIGAVVVSVVALARTEAAETVR